MRGGKTAVAPKTNVFPVYIVPIISWTKVVVFASNSYLTILVPVILATLKFRNNERKALFVELFRQLHEQTYYGGRAIS